MHKCCCVLQFWWLTSLGFYLVLFGPLQARHSPSFRDASISIISSLLSLSAAPDQISLRRAHSDHCETPTALTLFTFNYLQVTISSNQKVVFILLFTCTAGKSTSLIFVFIWVKHGASAYLPTRVTVVMGRRRETQRSVTVHRHLILTVRATNYVFNITPGVSDLPWLT